MARTSSTKTSKAASVAKAKELSAGAKEPAAEVKKETASDVDINMAETKITEIELLKRQNEMLKKQMDEMTAQMRELREQRAAAPQVVTVSADTERVHFLWQAPVADNNVVDFGPNGMYGRIVGKTGSFYVPKLDISKVLTSSVRNWINKRWLIIVSGLDESERVALNANYKDGEILDRRMFEKLVEYGGQILDIYPELCEEHKKMVAKAYYEAWRSKNVYIKRETVVALYKMSEEVAFKRIIEEMNAADIG